MAPLLVLVVVTLALRAAGAAGLRRLGSWTVALRGGLAAMFLVTGTAHFIGMRAEMISMVPPGLPAPGVLVTITGVLELAGAGGLLWHRTAPLAAACLALLMIAMFPANVHAAREELTTSTGDRLLPRTLMQIVFVAAAAAIPIHHWRQHRRRAGSGPVR